MDWRRVSGATAAGRARSDRFPWRRDRPSRLCGVTRSHAGLILIMRLIEVTPGFRTHQRKKSEMKINAVATPTRLPPCFSTGFIGILCVFFACKTS